MAHVDAARLGVDSNVVEVLRATGSLSQRNFLDQVVTARRRSRHSNHPAQYEEGTNRKPAHAGNSHAGNCHGTAFLFLRTLRRMESQPGPFGPPTSSLTEPIPRLYDSD